MSQDLPPDGYLRQVSITAPNFWLAVERLRDSRDPSWLYTESAIERRLPAYSRCIDDYRKHFALLAAWRVTRGVYRFDADLKEALLATPILGRLPAEHLLRLPAWSGFIEGDPGWSDAAGFWWSIDRVDRRPILRLVPLVWSTGAYGGSFWMPCNEQTIDLSDTVETAAKKNESKELPAYKWKSAVSKANWEKSLAVCMGRRLALLLYLCADDADLPDAHPAHPSTRRIRQRKDCPVRAVEWDVGVRVGATLRQARSEAEDVGGTHASPRAHVRSAHWHSFWTGPRTGEQLLRLRWLSPILVGAGETVTVIRPVRDIGPRVC
jgi:hypothetical protein